MTRTIAAAVTSAGAGADDAASAVGRGRRR